MLLGSADLLASEAWSPIKYRVKLSLEPKVRGAAEQKGMFDDRGQSLVRAFYLALAATEIPEGGWRRGETFMQPTYRPERSHRK